MATVLQAAARKYAERHWVRAQPRPVEHPLAVAHQRADAVHDVKPRVTTLLLVRLPLASSLPCQPRLPASGPLSPPPGNELLPVTTLPGSKARLEQPASSGR